MNYTKEFKQAVESNAFIGNGNPNSNILIAGKKVVTNSDSSSPIEN